MGSSKLFLSLVLLLSSWVFMGYAQESLAGLLSSLSNVAGANDAAAGAGLPLGNAASSMACAQKIVPCKDYLKPPSSPTDACCTPLKQMIHEDPKCLCNIFNNEELLKTFGVTQHEALKLLVECGTKADIRQCNSTAASAPEKSAPADPIPPPKTSTTPTGGASNGELASLLSSLNGTLNATNGTTAPADPAPASKNSAYSEKISLFGGFGFIAVFTSLFLSA
ncbi:hypothetical protein MKW94_030735 [Papaver nudicaule]|uniref:Bifunctional inhibitor/plant lipid transfer protein/seed storage helical domain-containing protein n=1 Tax=Papaver nudicaule TaxID=74823 RepID=A0AA41RTC7_PAPNU|nr:hypothetical protein [Papaver nudicaule]